MAVSKAQQKAVNKYMAANYDRINLTVPKGKKDTIQAHAEAQGESVNGFINRAIDNQISQDRHKGPSEAPQGPSGGEMVLSTLRAGEGPESGPERRGGIAHGYRGTAQAVQ